MGHKILLAANRALTRMNRASTHNDLDDVEQFRQGRIEAAMGGRHGLLTKSRLFFVVVLSTLQTFTRSGDGGQCTFLIITMLI